MQPQLFTLIQGEVEQIALMKPKALTENDDGMLEYLEDIIGSSRLKVHIFHLEHSQSCSLSGVVQQIFQFFVEL